MANSTQIYPQIDTNYFDNKIHIRASSQILNTTSVIFVLPCESISGKAEFVICYGRNKVKFRIVKEDFAGNIVDVGAGDIVSNRLCMFRINPYDNSEIILCNALTLDSMSINNLSCNNARFNNMPSVNAGDHDEYLMSAPKEASLIKDLDDRYQKKIIVGTESPSDYCRENFVESGQIYVQVAEKEN